MLPEVVAHPNAAVPDDQQVRGVHAVRDGRLWQVFGGRRHHWLNGPIGGYRGAHWLKEMSRVKCFVADYITSP
jgi:hypothetical protein